MKVAFVIGENCDSCIIEAKRVYRWKNMWIKNRSCGLFS